MNFDSADLFRTAPLIVLTISGLLLLLLDAFSRVRLVGRDYQKKMPVETSEAYAVPVEGSRSYLMPLTVLCLLGALLAIAWQWGEAEKATHMYRNMLVLDRFGLFGSGICVVAAALSVLSAPAYLRQHRMEFGEYYALVLFSVAGMVMLVAASDLVSIFLGLETVSLGVYVLTGSQRRSPRSSEAAMKYFLMGAFVSALMVYGIALIYGCSGASGVAPTTELALLGNRMATLSGQPLFYIGLFLLLSGFAFKVAAVPFHMWAPDAYEGAPTPVTGFMMACVKTAGFLSLTRLCVVALKHTEVATGPTGWVQVLYVLCALSMTLGNLGALRQENIKRMLAYSSVAHAGYLLLGVMAVGMVGQDAQGPLLYYLLSYAITAVGAMAVVSWVGIGNPDSERLSLEEWSGLGQRRPLAALVMTLLLLSLGGFPPTAGFFGKFYLFRAALMKETLLPLVLLGIANSLVSVYYYLRVITEMYFRDPPAMQGPEIPEKVPGLTPSVILAGLLVLGLGLLPGWVSNAAAAALLGS